MFNRNVWVATVGAALATVQASGQAIDASFVQLAGDGLTPVARSVASAAYFDQRLPLHALPSFVAVQTTGERADALANALAAAGIVGAQTQPSTVPGWTYVRLASEAGRGVAMVSATSAVEALAKQPGVTMASVMYLGDGELPMIPTRDLLVMFRDDVQPANQEAILARFGAEIIERDAAGSAGLVRARTNVSTGSEMLRLEQAVNDHPLVEFAQSDRINWMQRFGVPNDPMFGQQWALEQTNDEDMDALAAWAYSMGDPSIRVVVLDSGVQQDHPDISQVPGQSFTGSGTNGGPGATCDNHGTAVAGCIAATANNGIGIAGIAPNTRVQAGKIFNETSFLGLFCLPFLEAQDSWTVAGINWASTSGARVTNSSWGGGTPSAAITNAFNTTRAAGVLHFAAAGNDGTSTISFPANLASVNAVAAMASNGARASFSTYGAGLFISAPGAAVMTTDRTGSAGYGSTNWTTIDGTSFASPYAAGVAALVLSVDPSLTPAEVEAILAQTAVDKGAAGYDTDFGWGFINAGAAVEAAAGSTSCPADLNNDGELDFFDVAAFLSAFSTLDPIADFNNDTLFDFFDVAAFLSAFSVGCP